MAPDRGPSPSASPSRTSDSPNIFHASEQDAETHSQNDDSSLEGRNPGDESRRERSRTTYLKHAAGGRNFTFRGLAVGLAIGILITLSNTYFGLQTGWISGMTMPASLISFAVFKTASRVLSYPFTPVEHVLIQTVASAVGTMPLAAGFVGVIPAIEYLLRPEEGGPIHLSVIRLIMWSIGLSIFGAVFAVPLRREVIIREKLRFPSGTATALLIRVLHGDKEGEGSQEGSDSVRRRKARTASIQHEDDHEHNETQPHAGTSFTEQITDSFTDDTRTLVPESEVEDGKEFVSQIRLLTISFFGSAVYTLFTYFIPLLRNLPVFGFYAANEWLWAFNPSPAYVGQGIIMGTTTTLHMLVGAIIGWGILSPLANRMEWAPGPVSSWEDGSKGWIIWISLAIMLADSIVSLAWLVVRPLAFLVARRFRHWIASDNSGRLWHFGFLRGSSGKARYRPLLDSGDHQDPADDSDGSHPLDANPKHRGWGTSDFEDESEPDAPSDQLISNRVAAIGFAASIVLCIVTIHFAFPSLIPFYATILSLFLACLLSIMGVRALGETDLNPVSGISKLTQLFFALVVSTSAPGAALINLVAGAVSEAGALQAGDMMQDLKTGHILGASPKAQFYGQIIGGVVGSVVAALAYRMYTAVYEVPGDLFQIPTGFLWIFTARLVTGSGLPPKATEWAIGAAVVFAFLTVIRIIAKERGATWQKWVPGGIAVAVGMYNVPSFTLARVIGGLLHFYWVSRSARKRKGVENSEQEASHLDSTPVIVLASGLILGEGVISIVNLVLASIGVPHL